MYQPGCQKLHHKIYQNMEQKQYQNMEQKYIKIWNKNISKYGAKNISKCGAKIHQHMEQKIYQNMGQKYIKIWSKKYLKYGSENISNYVAENIPKTESSGVQQLKKQMPYVGVRKQPTWQYFGSVAWATKLRPGKTWSGRIPMDASAPDHRQNGRPDPAKALSVKLRHHERQRTA